MIRSSLKRVMKPLRIRNLASLVSKPGEPIRCLAAVARRPQKEYWHRDALQLEEVIVAPPKAGEVRIKITHAVSSHTDCLALADEDAAGKFPRILGHEAAGVVESVGEGVRAVQPGDHVIRCYRANFFQEDPMNSFTPHGQEYIVRKTNLGGEIGTYTSAGIMKADGNTRFKAVSDEVEFFHYMGISAFSQFTVLHEQSVIKIRKDAPLEKMNLFGCLMDVPTLVDLYMNGEFEIDAYITHNLNLADINDSFILLHKDQSSRTVIWMDNDAPVS